MTKTELIANNQRLVGAKTRFGHDIPVYDDGYGPLWIHRDSLGISGIVRAQKWYDAYEIFEDEFFPEADETVEELVKEYGFKQETVKMIHPICPITNSVNYSITRPAELSDYNPTLRDGQFVTWKTIETPDEDAWNENALFCEAFGFRPNGPNSRDKIGHGIYAKDLNGDRLDLLTDELVKELGITIELEDEEE